MKTKNVLFFLQKQNLELRKVEGCQKLESCRRPVGENKWTTFQWMYTIFIKAEDIESEADTCSHYYTFAHFHQSGGSSMAIAISIGEYFYFLCMTFNISQRKTEIQEQFENQTEKNKIQNEIADNNRNKLISKQRLHLIQGVPIRLLRKSFLCNKFRPRHWYTWYSTIKILTEFISMQRP